MEPLDQVMEIFIKIYGLGFQQTLEWVQEAHRTLDDLLKSPNVKLTPNQKVGIEHHEDSQLRIPRQEAEQLANIVQGCLQKFDSGLQIMIGGSYRCGAPNSGDIDIIITKRGATAGDLRYVATEKAVAVAREGWFLDCRLGSHAQSRWVEVAWCVPAASESRHNEHHQPECAWDE